MFHGIVNENEIVKILIGFGILILCAAFCAVAGFVLTSKFPYWTFNELVFPPKEVKHS